MKGFEIRYLDGDTITWYWICFNCQGQVMVDRQTYRLLQRKQLLGVRCDDCLTPPGKPALAAA